MIYRLTLKSSPKTFLPLLYSFIIFAAGVLSLIFLKTTAVTVIGFILIAAGLFVGYGSYRNILPLIKSHLESTADSLTYDTGYGERIIISFKNIEHAGMFTEQSGRKTLFVFSEKENQILTISDNMTDFDHLKSIIEGIKKLDLHDLAPGENAYEKTKEIYG